MAEDESSQASQSGLASESGSVTSVGEPAVVRERAPAIERGAVIAGRYQVEEVIGKGGSGVVLRAFDRTAQTVVALKVLKPELTHDPKWSRRFARELRLGRPIRHPNVCRIFDIGEADGYKFLTMELAKQGTLRDLIKAGEPLRPLAERIADAAAVIDGLSAIHAAGIVHRDVKPDNLLRMEDGRLAISDFGLATDLPDATAVSVFVGTPHYMAPEVRTGEPATTRSDVWALGVVLHEIFYGQRPQRRSSKSSDEYSRPPASLTGSVLERAMLVLCERCLAENPFDRPADAGAVARLLHAAQGAPRVFSRRRTLTPLVLAGVFVVAASAAALVLSRHRAKVAPNNGSAAHLVPTGEGRDWTASARSVAQVHGRVHCFAVVAPHTARLVWGAPRVAEDVDVASGQRTPAPISKETYAVGCPDLSPGGEALLYTAHNAEGASEIRLAGPDGRNSRTITPGADPVWLRRSDEFVYNVDRSHAAVFSLPTMALVLLSQDGGGAWPILAKATDPASGSLAITFATNNADRTVAIYKDGALTDPTVFKIAFPYSMDFRPHSHELFLSYEPSPSQSSLVAFDGDANSLRSVGRYRGMSIAGVKFDGPTSVLLTRVQSRDLWFHDGHEPVRLTQDGQTVSGALSPKGDLLASKRNDDGTIVIVWRSPTAPSKNLTTGPFDALPDFAPDGDQWVYVDYERKRLMLCRLSTQECGVLRDDPLLPAWPRFSPSGDQLAFITQVNIPRLKVLSLRDRSIRDLGPTFGQCPPVWSSNTRVWGLEGSRGSYFWSERDVTTERRLDGRVALDDVVDESEQLHCSPRNVPPTSPFFERVRSQVDERSALFVLPADGA